MSDAKTLEAELARLKLYLWNLNYLTALHTAISEICEDLALRGSYIAPNQSPWPFYEQKLKAAKYANHMQSKLDVHTVKTYVH
jgi:hypothetical protein